MKIETKMSIAWWIMTILIILLAFSCSQKPKEINWCDGDHVTFYVPVGYKGRVSHPTCSYSIIELNHNYGYIANYIGKSPSEDLKYKKYKHMFKDCDRRRCQIVQLSNKNYDWYKEEFEQDFGVKFPFPRPI